MAAKYTGGKLIRRVKAGSRTIDVECVTGTNAWIRPSGFPTSETQAEFAKIVEGKVDELNPKTKTVSMKEDVHSSTGDVIPHYTALQLDGNNKLLDTTHFYKRRVEENNEENKEENKEEKNGSDGKGKAK